MKYIVGTKIGMVQLYDVNGKAIACTVISCEPNRVLEVKGSSVKVGYGSQKENKVNKAKAGIFKKVGSEVKQYIRTFSNIEGSYSVGDDINVTTFKQGEYVDAQAFNKGHGFTGAIKR
jgi:large subunit ribosomal protein L3